MPEARILADALYKRDPMRVKHFHKVWGKVDPPPLRGYSRYGYYPYPEWYSDSRMWEPTFPYYVLDTEPGEYMSLEDQQEEAANRIASLGRFQFLCRPTTSEGDVSPAVFPITIEHVDRDPATGWHVYPEQTVDAQVRSLLAAQSGIPITQLLAEQDALIPTDMHQELPRPKIPGTAASFPQRTSDVQPSTDKAAPAHPPLPPRRHRIPTRPE